MQYPWAVIPWRTAVIPPIVYVYVFKEGGENKGGIRGRQGAATEKYDGPIHSGECFFICDIRLQFCLFLLVVLDIRFLINRNLILIYLKYNHKNTY